MNDLHSRYRLDLYEHRPTKVFLLIQEKGAWKLVPPLTRTSKLVEECYKELGHRHGQACYELLNQRY